MLITSVNVITIFADKFDQVKPQDVNVIFNNIWGLKAMSQGENWTTICMPGCSEEYMLNIYTYFKYQNLGMVLVCTD